MEQNLTDLAAGLTVRFGARPPEMARNEWDKALLRAHARLEPGSYFTCSACKSGPWHKSWAAEHGRLPRKPLGPCCSGAD